MGPNHLQSCCATNVVKRLATNVASTLRCPIGRPIRVDFVVVVVVIDVAHSFGFGFCDRTSAVQPVLVAAPNRQVASGKWQAHPKSTMQQLPGPQPPPLPRYASLTYSYPVSVSIAVFNFAVSIAFPFPSVAKVLHAKLQVKRAAKISSISGCIYGR